MNALTYDLKSAYQILEANDEVNIQRTDFLAWYSRLLSIRNILYHLWTLAGLAETSIYEQPTEGLPLLLTLLQ